MTLTSVTIILGFNMGIEYIPAMPKDDIERSVIVDMGFVRFIFSLN